MPKKEYAKIVSIDISIESIKMNERIGHSVINH